MLSIISIQEVWTPVAESGKWAWSVIIMFVSCEIMISQTDWGEPEQATKYSSKFAVSMLCMFVAH